jgi:tetratricopeptide (TPR) repeat protein
MKQIILGLLMIALATTAPAQNIELQEAKKLFNEGEIQKAIDILQRLVTTRTLSPKDYIEANEYLAVAYVSTNQEAAAEEIFTQVLKKNADYRPSDNWWPHQRLMASYYKTVQNVRGSLEVQAGPGIQTIAFMDFENNSIDDAEKYTNLGNALSKIIISDFGVLSNLRIVERERLQYLISELELTDKKVGGKNIMDPAMAPRVGKLLGAHSFVFGSFIRFGKTFRMDVRLVKTETGEIFKTASVEGKPDNVFELAKKLTLEITKNLDVAIEKAEREKLEKIGKEDVPIEAIALLGDAMSLANQEDYKLALAKLEEALKIAPDFPKAHDMLAVVRPLALNKFAAN